MEEVKKKEKAPTEKELLAKYLPCETVSTVAEAIDLAVELSFKLKALEIRLDKYKAFSRAVFSPGEQVNGDVGFVLVTSATVSEAEPEELYKLLIEVRREQEFYPLVKVKIADARKALGTTLFGEIATEKSGVSRVKFGKLKLVK